MCNLQGIVPGTPMESRSLQEFVIPTAEKCVIYKGLRRVCPENHVLYKAYIHRDGRMMCNLQGIAHMTLTESFNFQDIRHCDGRLMCNLQGIVRATPMDSCSLQDIQHRDAN